MKYLKLVFLSTFILLSSVVAQANKPYSQWDKSDILSYFDNNSIVFEGEFQNPTTNSSILIGYTLNTDNRINFNFYIVDGKFTKALVTTSENVSFQSLQTSIEKRGFKLVSDTSDKIGNQYKKFQAEDVEITVINKRADWPEFYFQP